MSLYVNQLPFKLTKEEFISAFEEFGPIKGVTIAKSFNPAEKRNRGFGFVDFENEEDKIKCINSGKRIYIKDREVFYREARPRPVCNDTAFIGKIAEGVTEKMLEEIFENHHPVEVKILRSFKSEEIMGFGYAKFSSEEERDKAIKDLNGTELMGTEILVRIADRPFREERSHHNFY